MATFFKTFRKKNKSVKDRLKQMTIQLEQYRDQAILMFEKMRTTRGVVPEVFRPIMHLRFFEPTQTKDEAGNKILEEERKRLYSEHAALIIKTRMINDIMVDDDPPLPVKTDFFKPATNVIQVTNTADYEIDVKLKGSEETGLPPELPSDFRLAVPATKGQVLIFVLPGQKIKATDEGLTYKACKEMRSEAFISDLRHMEGASNFLSNCVGFSVFSNPDENLRSIESFNTEISKVLTRWKDITSFMSLSAIQAKMGGYEIRAVDRIMTRVRQFSNACVSKQSEIADNTVNPAKLKSKARQAMMPSRDGISFKVPALRRTEPIGIHNQSTAEKPADGMFYVHETQVLSAEKSGNEKTIKVVLRDPVSSIFSCSILAGARLVLDSNELRFYMRQIRTLFSSGPEERQSIKRIFEDQATSEDFGRDFYRIVNFWKSHQDLVQQELSVPIKNSETGQIESVPAKIEILLLQDERLVCPGLTAEAIIKTGWPSLTDAQSVDFTKLITRLNKYYKADYGKDKDAGAGDIDRWAFEHLSRRLQQETPAVEGGVPGLLFWMILAALSGMNLQKTQTARLFNFLITAMRFKSLEVTSKGRRKSLKYKTTMPTCRWDPIKQDQLKSTLCLQKRMLLRQHL